MPAETAPIQLRRILGRRDVIAISFGAMVGWSWVVLAGEMIVRAGVLGSIAAFATGAVMVWLVGLTYAELTSALSRAGGEVGFTFVGLGTGVAYVCGWTLVLAYVSVCAFEAVALPTVLGYLLPDFETGYLYTVAGWEVHLSWVAVGVVGSLVVGVVNYRGIQFAALVQGMAALLLLSVGVSFFVPGIATGDLANADPAFTGWEGFFRVVVMTPFLFIGFDVIPQVAEDINIPFRTVGRLILFSIALALGWYVLVQWTVGVTLPTSSLTDLELPTADAMSAVYASPWGGRVLVVGGLLGIATSWNAFFIGGVPVAVRHVAGWSTTPRFLASASDARVAGRRCLPVDGDHDRRPVLWSPGTGLARGCRGLCRRDRVLVGRGVVSEDSPPPPRPRSTLSRTKRPPRGGAGHCGHRVLRAALSPGQPLGPRLAV